MSCDASDGKLTRTLKLSLIPNTVDSKSLTQMALPHRTQAESTLASSLCAQIEKMMEDGAGS